MRLFIYALTAAAGVAALAALGAVSRSLGGWRWEAFESRAEPPGRVPAVEAPAEPTLVVLTESDIDSVPARLEPRPAARPEPEVALGDVAPRPAAKKKAVRRKKPRLKPTLRGRPGLTLRAPTGFDGAAQESSAWAEPQEAPQAPEVYEEAEPQPEAEAAPAPKRTFRSLSGTPQ